MNYANLHLHSDCFPFEIVERISEKTIKIREMTATLSPDFKPIAVVGGFCAHVTNNRDQSYTYESNENEEIITARLRKDGKYHSVRGAHYLSNEPYRFYDYNF